jgi:hypothetical protein
MKITEAYLDEFVKCPLRALSNYEVPPDQTNQAAMETVRWFMVQCFNGSTPNRHSIQEAFEREWAEIDDRIPIPVPFVRRFCVQLDELRSKYKVIQPMSRYSNFLDGIEITGEFGVLQARKPRARNKEPITYVVKFTTCYTGFPSPGDLSSWLHYNTHIRKNAGLLFITIPELTACPFYGILEGVARDYIHKAVDVALAGHLYPSPGLHCKTCPTLACLAVFQEVPKHARRA